MKNKMKVVASMFALSALTVLNISAQNAADYAYQNQNGRAYPNPNGTTYQTPNNTRYQYPNRGSNVYTNDANARYQRRAYYVNSPELQRLYQTEDALLSRYTADLTLGDNRAARIDREKLEDVREHIAKEERRFLRMHPINNNNNRNNGRPDYDRDGRR